jgi:hypothetical protein
VAEKKEDREVKLRITHFIIGITAASIIFDFNLTALGKILKLCLITIGIEYLLPPPLYSNML